MEAKKIGFTMLYDNHNRRINYLRLAVTDRCNLRCFYCMPEEGIDYVPKAELLTFEEMVRTVTALAEMGIEKVRITGGEPFVRRGIESFLEKLVAIPGIKQVNLTTNGTLTTPYIPLLKDLGITNVNLSLDTLDRKRFHQITRRDYLPEVMRCMEKMLSEGFHIKINAVVMDGQNIEDLVSLARLAETAPIDVRFIEEMPFNGEGAHYAKLNWNYKAILAHLEKDLGTLEKLPDPPHSTSMNYRAPNFLGKIGIIAAYSRTFCGTCNRIRLTPTGLLKTCLYDEGVFNVTKFLRAGVDDAGLKSIFMEALAHRAKDGYEAEKNRVISKITESMAAIGG